MRHILFFLLLLLLLTGRAAAAQGDGLVPRCYYPDGTVATNDYACRLDTGESFCCTTNVTCLDNKICAVLAPTQYQFNRGTCTDKTWTSDECPKFCQAQSPRYGSGIIRCKDADGEVCCDNDNRDANATCCRDPSGLFALSGSWDVFRTIDEAAARATRSVATAEPSAVQTSAASSTAAGGGGGLQTGAIVGIAVGGVVGVVAAVLLVLWMVRKKRRRKPREVPPERAELDGSGMRHEMKADEVRHEVGGRQAPQELSSGDERHEMEGSSPMDQKVVGGRQEATS